MKISQAIKFLTDLSQDTGDIKIEDLTGFWLGRDRVTDETVVVCSFPRRSRSSPNEDVQPIVLYDGTISSKPAERDSEGNIIHDPSWVKFLSDVRDGKWDKF